MSNLTAVPASKRKSKALLLRPKTWLLYFLPLTIVVFILLSRKDVSLSLVVNDRVMALENAIGRELPLLHKIFDLKFKRSQDELFSRVKIEDVYVIIMLMDNGVSANFREPEEGETPLTFALKANKILSIERLLLKGADPDYKNSIGLAPINLAAKAESVMGLRWLLHYKANVDSQDTSGKSPLVYLSSKGRPDLLRILLSAGADPNLQDANGRTALSYAIEANDTKSVRELLNYKASTEILDLDGRSVFFYLKSPEMTKTLNELGVENVPDLDALAKSLAVEVKKPPAQQAQVPTHRVAKPKPAPRSKPKTRLRVVKQPKGTWVYGKSVKLSAIEVNIRNVGDVDAKDVKVEVETAGGNVFLMIGPTELEAYTNQTYTATPSVTVDRVGKLRATATCSNCYR